MKPGQKHSEKTKQVIAEKKKWRIPPRLLNRGITQEEYTWNLSNGNRWCFYHEKFESANDFRITKQRRPCRLGEQQLSKERKRAKRTDEQRHKSVTSRYKTDPHWYDAKFQEQGGHCGLCDAVPKQSRRFGIDHDHRCCPRTPGSGSCGKCNRGILCDPCNHRLGHLEILLVMIETIMPIKDSWLDKALQYLKQYSQESGNGKDC